VSGVGSGIRVLDVGPDSPREDDVSGFFWSIGLNSVLEFIGNREMYSTRA